jgi:hypothetical protein
MDVPQNFEREQNFQDLLDTHAYFGENFVLKIVRQTKTMFELVVKFGQIQSV